MNAFRLLTCFSLCCLSWVAMAQPAPTYAEKLGWPKGAKVIILHVDDAGMFFSANQGTLKAMEQGTASSCSIMMPCALAASFTKYAISHPTLDCGIHLTLTSEWKDYRWSPLSGAKQVPGLIDKEGAFWPSVEEVVKHATPDEVEREIRAQVDRAITMGLKPTHMDSHMGTLFASPGFMERYIKVGAEYRIPVMFPGGNNKLLTECQNYPIIKKLKAEGKWKDGMTLPTPAVVQQAKSVGETIWKAGLPVLDDLHTISGEWKPEGVANLTPEAWGNYKVQQFKDAFTRMEPGVTMFIVHCNDLNDNFKYISSTGGTRYADMLSMMDPELKAYIKAEGIILTTWREMMERRMKAK